MKLNPLIYLVLLCCSFSAFSAVSGLAKITGKVVSYDAKFVTLRQTKGGPKIKVKRSSIPKHFPLKSGAYVESIAPAEDFQEPLKQSHKKKVKKILSSK